MDLERTFKDILLFAYVDFELCLEQRPLGPVMA
jgi:hypothetical protein